MGRPKKVTLKSILFVPEINPRDPKARGSKARSLGIDALGEDNLKAMTSGIKANLKDTAQGPSIDGAIEPLLIAPPPLDLPKKYRDRLKDATFVLVDGYQRYEAIERSVGPEVRVPVKEIDAGTMAELMSAALEANSRHPLPLAESEKRAQVFRLLLLDFYDEGIDKLHQRYGGTFSRTTLHKYMRLAKFAREEAKLKDLPPGQLKTRLIDAIREALHPFYDVLTDSKGYPVPKCIAWWKEVVETGDISALVERKEAEELKRQQERDSYRKKLAETQQGISLEVQQTELKRALSIIDKELEERLDENFD